MARDGPTLDDVERGIVRLLQDDGRMTTTELSRRLSVSEPTIRKKLNRILDAGLVTIRAVADPAHLGYTTGAYIGFVVDRDHLEDLANKLTRYDFVDSVVISTGPNDITIKAYFRSISEMYSFLHDEMRNISGLRDTDTTLVFRELKYFGFKGAVGVAMADDGSIIYENGGAQ
jgi:Lrp/AsnC family transcriptional regulator for asnA, asnC and gidA